MASSKRNDVSISGARRVEIRQDLAPPPLQVTFPAGAVTEERFVLAGSTEPGARVFVSGKGVPATETGTFTTEVTIRPGMNLVAVEVVDGAGNVTYRSHYVQGRF
ncbi:MAG: hypothetical protein ED859_00480 [Desulfuromonadales bacterium]|nr:MAG: hypothetical protein ED859_00480 [Desulfuromonadales bacterium]